MYSLASLAYIVPLSLSQTFLEMFTSKLGKVRGNLLALHEFEFKWIFNPWHKASWYPFLSLLYTIKQKRMSAEQNIHQAARLSSSCVLVVVCVSINRPNFFSFVAKKTGFCQMYTADGVLLPHVRPVDLFLPSILWVVVCYSSQFSLSFNLVHLLPLSFYPKIQYFNWLSLLCINWLSFP